MSRKRQQGKASAEDEASSNTVNRTGQTPNEKLPAQTFDEYQCSGNVEIDFPELCALLHMRNIPAVTTKQPAYNTDTEGEDTGKIRDKGQAEKRTSRIATAPFWSKPYLHVELESEDPFSTKNLKIAGWKIDEQIARVLQKVLLALTELQELHFWQAGLTDRMVISFVDTIPLCSKLSSVTLEDNPLPEQSYHLLLSEDSPLTHLSLRNNRMGDEGARLIGSALSTNTCANSKLLFLNLACNSIGDAGATHIAEGLRLNRALLFLSLSNNHIGDSGAAHLAAILGEFALTHEEVVARRKLLEGTQSSSFRAESAQSPASQLPLVPSSTSLGVIKGENKGKKKEILKKDKKPAANPKPTKKTSDMKVPQSKDVKQGSKEKYSQEDNSSTALNEAEAVEIVNPLLDPAVQRKDGEVILPGNTILSSLNLAGNRITEKSLPLFLKSLEMQGDGEGLLRLCLQRNRFPPECETYVKIQKLMTLRDPLRRNIPETEEEGQGSSR